MEGRRGGRHEAQAQDGAPVCRRAFRQRHCSNVRALIRRLPGLERVSKVEVVRIDTAEGPNWDLAHVEIEPPLSAADRERVEAVIEPWRRRFNMLGDGREALHKAHSEARV